MYNFILYVVEDDCSPLGRLPQSAGAPAASTDEWSQHVLPGHRRQNPTTLGGRGPTNQYY